MQKGRNREITQNKLDAERAERAGNDTQDRGIGSNENGEAFKEPTGQVPQQISREFSPLQAREWAGKLGCMLKDVQTWTH